MKILVADDDAVSRSMMRRMLTRSGYEVATATNGDEAIRILMSNEPPRLVLLDWMMPELDGPEVCRAVRNALSDSYTYITLLTSKESKEDLVLGLEAGADDYLTKPCHLEELRARLRTGERILQLEDILVKAREEMRFRATHDALTSLLNRGTIFQRLCSLLAAPRKREFTIVLCDVDHFKRVNDVHGHPVGDEVLREISQRLQRFGQDGDAVGRYGGEEFLLILGSGSARTVRDEAEHICEAIRSEPISTAAGLLSVTLSAGAISIPPDIIHSSADQVLKLADEALYQAKRSGRARAVVASFNAYQEQAGIGVESNSSLIEVQITL